MDIYLVGGAIRDRLLGLPATERDWVVVGATPEAMRARGFRAVGRDFPVFLHPETGEEYALARTERKTGPGHGGFAFHAAPEITLEEDLRRRDLTINAIAESPDGTLIDPYGGRRDLQRRLLRHVSEAFVEDPLRVLRVARFAARLQPLGFRVAAETRELMARIAAGDELRQLSAERVWKETRRALAAAAPRAFVSVLRDCGALRVLFPEIDALFGVPQRADFHPEIDTGAHLLMALDRAAQLSPDPRVRFAVLVHDLGKGVTPAQILPRHIGHEHAGLPLVEDVCTRLRVPGEYRRLAMLVTRLHLQCHKARELRPDTLLRLFRDLDIYRRPQTLEHFLLACEADARGRGGDFSSRRYEPGDWLRALAARLRAVHAQPYLAAGLQGAELAAALDTERRAVIVAHQRETRGG